MWKYFIFLFLVPGCLPKEVCPDELDPDFPADNLEWFSYEVGDTLFFKNPLNEETFHMFCYYKLSGLDSSFEEEYNCENEGYYNISRFISHEFQTNFPHFQNEELFLTFNIIGSPYSILDLTFRNEYFSSYYGYTFRYNPEENEIINLYPGSSEVSYIDTLNIDSAKYLNVYTINKPELPEGAAEFFYDTIYYNKDGFLKFISSQYGYRLERLP